MAVSPTAWLSCAECAAVKDAAMLRWLNAALTPIEAVDKKRKGGKQSALRLKSRLLVSITPRFLSGANFESFSFFFCLAAQSTSDLDLTEAYPIS